MTCRHYGRHVAGIVVVVDVKAPTKRADIYLFIII